MGKTAIIYGRVSTGRQAEKELPVESQLEQCQKKASALEAVVLMVFRDDGVSGTKASRAAWQSALLYCEMHDVDYFICWDTKRFARNQFDAVMHKATLRKRGTQIIYVSQSFDGEDGWLMEGMHELWDQHQSQRTGRDTMRSMAKNAADGFFNGGRLPFGFRSVEIGKRKRLEPEPSEVSVVKTVFRWCNEGSGCKDIAMRLNQSGIAYRGKRWNKHLVGSVLSNAVAIGKLSFRVGAEVIVREDAHEAIISEEEFMRAQDAVKSRAPINVGGRPRSDAVFAGLMRCGACSQALMTETATGRAGVRYHYYNCRSHLKGMGCKSRRLPVDALDQYLLGVILDRLFSPENLRGIVVELKTAGSSWRRDHEAKRSVLRGELQSVKTKLDRLYESVEAGAGLQLADIAPRLREHQARRAAIEAELENLDQEEAPPVTIEQRDIEMTAELFREMVRECEDPKRIRGFLSTFVRQIVITADDASIEYWPERMVNAPGGGSDCDVRWLPDPSTLRTALLYVVLPGRLRKAA